MTEIERIIKEEVALNKVAGLEDTNNLAESIEQYVIKAKQEALINYKRLEEYHTELEVKWNKAHTQEVIKARIKENERYSEWEECLNRDMGVSERIAELKKGLK